MERRAISAPKITKKWTKPKIIYNNRKKRNKRREMFWLYILIAVAVTVIFFGYFLCYAMHTIRSVSSFLDRHGFRFTVLFFRFANLQICSNHVIVRFFFQLFAHKFSLEHISIVFGPLYSTNSHWFLYFIEHFSFSLNLDSVLRCYHNHLP